jgi:hypothetical protein
VSPVSPQTIAWTKGQMGRTVSITVGVVRPLSGKSLSSSRGRYPDKKARATKQLDLEARLDRYDEGRWGPQNLALAVQFVRFVGFVRIGKQSLLPGKLNLLNHLQAIKFDIQAFLDKAFVYSVALHSWVAFSIYYILTHRAHRHV